MKLGRYSNYKLYIPVVSGLLTLFLYCLVTETPMSIFTRDPLAVVNGKPYYGFVSNIGVLIWCVTTTICLFTWLIKRHSQQIGTLDHLFCLGCLTMLLLLDDLFMLHEYVFPKLLGIRQRYVILNYILITLAYLILLKREVLKRHTAKLTTALLFFIISVAADIFPVNSDQWQYLFEDGAKLLGIVSWFNYSAHVCSEEVMANLVTRTGQMIVMK